MDEDKKTQVEIDGASINVTGRNGRQVNVGPCGVHVKSNDSEVKVSWSGIKILNDKTNLNISVLKPLIGCGVAVLIFAALLTVVVTAIVKLML
ncbi:MAG: hypothetical protein WCV67_16865 [Victivallaceae bacterium]|jgi:hypothetical protein